MAETFQANKIAAGHNNAGSLTNIETIADSNGKYFAPVDDFGKWNPGIYKTGGDSIVKPQGMVSTSWVSTGFLTFEQWLYLYTTILSGAVSGLVTIATRKYDIATYVNCNATLTLDPPPTLQKGVAEYSPFVWRYTYITEI